MNIISNPTKKQHLFLFSFVKIYLLPDRSKNSKRKTSIKKGTTDPVYEEKFRVRYFVFRK